jgi:hypothetical protein
MLDYVVCPEMLPSAPGVSLSRSGIQSCHNIKLKTICCQIRSFGAGVLSGKIPLKAGLPPVSADDKP